MNRQLLIEEIRRLIETIDEQASSVIEHKGVIPAIEIDIITDNIKRLYQSFKDLEKVNLNNVNNKNLDNVIENAREELIESIHVPEVENAHEQMEGLPGAVPALVLNDTEAKTPQEAITDNIIIEPAPQLFAEEVVTPKKESTPVQPEPVKKKNKSPQSQGIDLFAEANNKASVADKYRDEKKSLNEKIAGDNKNETIGSKMQKTAIADLRTAIRINEKFLFINNLFDGSMQEYNECIESLNANENLQDALIVLNSLKAKYNWEDANDSYVLLVDLVNRRFL